MAEKKFDREQRIEVARMLIQAHPDYGRRRINQELRELTGKGLRSDYINALIKATHEEYGIVEIEEAPRETAKRYGFEDYEQYNRNYRYLRLRGFGQIESRTLATMDLAVPYARQMVQDRLYAVSDMLRMGFSQDVIAAAIYKDYVDAGRTKADAIGRLIIDPWKMLREYEDAWKAAHPEYIPPSRSKWNSSPKKREINRRWAAKQREKKRNENQGEFFVD